MKNIDSLPDDLRRRILNIWPNNTESWITKKIPALGGKSIVEVLHLPGAPCVIDDFLNQVESRWFANKGSRGVEPSNYEPPQSLEWARRGKK
ncbi:MAG: hypothetical protein ACI8W8_003710 [Rhodothermales bacterium]|jgi:hypothetical protein